MKKIIEKIEEAVKEAFAASEYDEKFAKVTVSNRPDLCVNISVMVLWRQQRLIRKRRL